MTFALEEAELAAFQARLARLTRAGGALASFFDAGAPIGLARAPGRLDVMGGIADYSGSLVLELPLGEAACVAAQVHPEPGVRVVSLDGESDSFREAHVPTSVLTGGAAAARAWFAAAGEDAWAAYVAGTVVPLVARGLALAGGARLVLASRVPEGKGVSSSAAIEVAAIFALAAAGGVDLDGESAALLCQEVENVVVGAPCGVMDQMTSACGRSGRLLELSCQPARIEAHVEIPDDIALFGIDSGLRHAVSGADYGDVRVGAFMGYRLIATMAGLAIEPGEAEGKVRVQDPRWGGYLANVTPEELEREFAAGLPERLSGREFLSRYAGITDAVTRVAEEKTYAVRAPTEHPIREHARVRRFAALLPSASEEPARRELGALMYAAHESYSRCGLGSPGTDRLVELVRAEGPDAGLYGAKITGGGSGGTVAVLARRSREAEDAVERVARSHAAESGHPPTVFRGSSWGAAAFGARRLAPSAL